jgi:hypothetical protein
MSVSWDIQHKIITQEPKIFSNRPLSGDALVVMEGLGIPSTWYKAGWLTIYIPVDGLLYQYDSRSINFGRSAIRVGLESFVLGFNPVDYLTLNYSSVFKAKSFTMQVSRNPRPFVGDKTYGTVAPGAANTAFTISAAKARSEIEIENRTNRTLYIKEGDAAVVPVLTAGSPFAAIAVGETGTVTNFDGIITGIFGATTAAGGQIVIRESLIQ